MTRYVDTRISQADRDALMTLAKTDRTAFAEVITEYVDPVYLAFDIASTFMNTREVAQGEIRVKRFKGKYHVHTLVPGQITLAEQIVVKDRAMAHTLDLISAKAGYNILELQNGGPAFTPEQVREDVRKAVEEKVLMRTWNALANIWTSGNSSSLTIPGAANSQFIDAAGPLTSTVLDAAIDHVNYWTPGVKSIIGTETALAPLSTFGQYQLISGASTDNYVTQNGQPAHTINNQSPYRAPYAVETYRGVTNIVRLKQIFDDTEFPKKPLLPNNFILVVGEDIGEFITYGGPQTKEFTDMNPTPPYWNYETWLQIGMMIWNAQGIVKIAVTPAAIP